MSRCSLLLSYVCLAATAFGVCFQVSFGRTWSSKDGHFQTEADLITADNKQVRLKKADGQEIVVPLEKLSDQDRQFIESWKREKNAAQKSRPRVQSAGRGKKNEPKLAPLRIKIFDDELTMQAPVGAKAEVQGVFPVVQFGERFKMWIEPYSDTDLKEFKERFANPSPALTLKKVLVQKDDALAYTVVVNAFNDTASAYMVVVAVGDKKYTCSDKSLEDINRRQKYTAEDIELMIRCARTLRASGDASDGADGRVGPR